MRLELSFQFEKRCTITKALRVRILQRRGVVTRNTLEAMVANLNLGPNNRPEGEDLRLRMGELG